MQKRNGVEPRKWPTPAKVSSHQGVPFLEGTHFGAGLKKNERAPTILGIPLLEKHLAGLALRGSSASRRERGAEPPGKANAGKVANASSDTEG